MIITIGGLKGGMGKTTIAVLLATVYTQRLQKKVLLVDADPKSQSAYDWHKLAGLPFALEVWPSVRVGELVADRAGGYDVVVIDTGGETDEIFASAVGVSDEVLVVCPPKKPDMRRLVATFTSAAKAAQGRRVTARLLLTMVDRRRSAYNATARQQLQAQGLPVMGAEVSLRSYYSDVYGTLPNVEELSEIDDVVKELAS